MDTFQIGQRWISEMEPELGLGVIIGIEKQTVLIRFPAAACERNYAIDSAPIRRVRFSPGDTVRSKSGTSFIVERIEEKEGRTVYFGEGMALPENDLFDALSFSTPKDRLLGGFLDDNRDFDLRYRTLQFYNRMRQSPVRGFIGGRISLIPHQLYVAAEIARRPLPRVLLSDEVGLGKTIEACLILHRLLLSGRISRILLLVPESLVHQWFVELLRKFNLFFRLIDEPYLASVSEKESGENPFLNDQLFLSSVEFLTEAEKYRQQAVQAGWDLLIVDEAHHLTEESAAYQMVRELSAGTPGLILITATPQQLGHRSHFARLQLLDPDRYHDFTSFEREADQFDQIARIAGKILDGRRLTPTEKKLVGDFTVHAKNLSDEKLRKKIIENLLDRYGPGRVVFRNTRAAMTNFPGRQVHLIALEGSRQTVAKLTAEFKSDLANQSIAQNFRDDPRVIWLARYLQQNEAEKTLLICRTIEKTHAIQDALREKVNVQTALFHEKMTLIQRDKNAAWFARPEGARLLICSEIGSEGRNFQFVHDLVLFDLPLDPERVEQRIGRLDRIGQTQTIRIWLPFVKQSPQENLVRWYHEGLQAFEKNIPGAYEIFRKLGDRVAETIFSPAGMEQLITETQVEMKTIAKKLESGRDRLLELHSFNPQAAERLKSEIETVDKNGELDRYALTVYNRFGIRFEQTTARTYLINFDLLDDPAFPVPLLREENLTATFDRDTAIHHEDIEFLTWDHPMITGAMELILGSEKGNSSAALWPGTGEQEILLQAIFVLECVAPPALHVDRFLPPTPIGMVVNHLLEDKSDIFTYDEINRHIKGIPSDVLLNNPMVKAKVPVMIDHCQEYAQNRVPEFIRAGLKKMNAALNSEIQRLLSLKKVNPNVREEEIELLQNEKKSLEDAIRSARLRLDALRLIVKM